MTNFWSGITKKEVDNLIEHYRNAKERTMNQEQIAEDAKYNLEQAERLLAETQDYLRASRADIALLDGDFSPVLKEKLDAHYYELGINRGLYRAIIERLYTKYIRL